MNRCVARAPLADRLVVRGLKGRELPLNWSCSSSCWIRLLACNRLGPRGHVVSNRSPKSGLIGRRGRREAVVGLYGSDQRVHSGPGSVFIDPVDPKRTSHSIQDPHSCLPLAIARRHRKSQKECRTRATNTSQCFCHSAGQCHAAPLKCRQDALKLFRENGWPVAFPIYLRAALL